eukprot:TRINITY_DN6402_c0_g1_i1.p1 TRINITY_DN6402_c0_g1~~TRINITY_DN6402_c0_g1_i1.p1  ORF type:complete len:448 (+),score=56.90 TRINITY_DN6402_c0_g1_i1:72-1415(+)
MAGLKNYAPQARPEHWRPQYASGLLPCCVDPDDNSPYFLLGQEGHCFGPFWGWQDFTDECLEHSAAREAWEEGLGTFGDMDFLRKCLELAPCLLFKNCFVLSLGVLSALQREAVRQTFLQRRAAMYDHLTDCQREMSDVLWVSAVSFKHAALSAPTNEREPVIRLPEFPSPRNRLRSFFSSWLAGNLNFTRGPIADFCDAGILPTVTFWKFEYLGLDRLPTPQLSNDPDLDPAPAPASAPAPAPAPAPALSVGTFGDGLAVSVLPVVYDPQLGQAFFLLSHVHNQYGPFHAWRMACEASITETAARAVFSQSQEIIGPVAHVAATIQADPVQIFPGCFMLSLGHMDDAHRQRFMREFQQRVHVKRGAVEKDQVLWVQVSQLQQACQDEKEGQEAVKLRGFGPAQRLEATFVRYLKGGVWNQASMQLLCELGTIPNKYYVPNICVEQE